MATYSIKKSKTDSRFVVMKDGHPMAACYTYSQAYGVLNRMQLDDTLISINKKYDKKEQKANFVLTICFSIVVSIIVIAGLIIKNK
jgi:hypothetical protein